MPPLRFPSSYTPPPFLLSAHTLPKICLTLWEIQVLLPWPSRYTAPPHQKKEWLGLRRTSRQREQWDICIWCPNEQEFRIAKKKLQHWYTSTLKLESNFPIWEWTNELTLGPDDYANILSLIFVTCSLVSWTVLSQENRDVLTISKFVTCAYRKPNRKFCGPRSIQTSSKYTLNVQLSNRPQISMGYRLINHAGCLWNTRRICQSRAARASYETPVTRTKSPISPLSRTL